MQSVRQSWTVFFVFCFLGLWTPKCPPCRHLVEKLVLVSFQGGLQFEDAVPVLLEGVSALLPGFPITMHSTLVNKLLQTVQVFFTILLSG